MIAKSGILFLCTGNYYRSRYVEELFNHRAKIESLPWRAFSREWRNRLARQRRPDVSLRPRCSCAGAGQDPQGRVIATTRVVAAFAVVASIAIIPVEIGNILTSWRLSPLLPPTGRIGSENRRLRTRLARGRSFLCCCLPVTLRACRGDMQPRRIGPRLVGRAEVRLTSPPEKAIPSAAL
jgi:hypothetical protein